MGKLVIGLLVGLVLGVLGGALLVGPAMLGVGAGTGIATGMSAGICSTLQAAQEEGIMTAEQVDQVLARAARDLGGELPEGAGMVGSAAECETIMEDLRAAAAQ